MSRRTGQKGNVYQPHAQSKQWEPKTPAYGRYWIDIPGQDRKRETVSLGLCLTRSVARQRLVQHIEQKGINSVQRFIETTSPATTFRQQAGNWIASLSTRRRRPVKPATILAWRYALDKWFLPHIGDKRLADVGNAVLRAMIDKWTAAGLSPGSIVNYSKIIKLVLASAIDADGEQIHPRKWNHDFVGLPIVDPATQRRPTVTRAELEGILAAINPRYAVLVALLAATGLRIGEGLGVQVNDFTDDCRVLHVRRSIWSGRVQIPKTSNAIRVVDIPEELARILRGYVAGKSGFLFPTRAGTPLLQRNVRRHLDSAHASVGFHAFRRYRTAVLRKARVPEDLIGMWLGHARNLTDWYAAQLRDDTAFRSEWCERAGLGFQMGYIGLHLGYTKVTPDAVEVA